MALTIRCGVASCAAVALLSFTSSALAQTAGNVREELPPPTGLAPYLAPVTSGSATPDADGFIKRWLLLEPLVEPNRTNAGFTPSYVREKLALERFPGRIDRLPRDGDVAPAPDRPRWHALDAAPFDVKLFKLAQGLGKSTYGVIFWAVTVIDSPRDHDGVRLAVGSNSASRWWLNGAEAVGLYGDRRMVMDDVVSAPLRLRRGRNLLRGAVINGPGMSDFCLRFLDSAGQPLRDITVDVR